MSDGDRCKNVLGGPCYAHDAVERAAEVYAERSVAWAKLNPMRWELAASGKAYLELDNGLPSGNSLPCSRKATAQQGCKLPRVYFVFALPGMGKSTLAAGIPCAIDADYGNWRRIYGYSREQLYVIDYCQQLENFLDMLAGSIAIHLKHGPRVVVFVNNLDLLPYVRELGYAAVLVIPAEGFVPEWLEGIRRREDRKVTRLEDGYTSFADKATHRHGKWLSDWEWAGRRNATPVYALDSWLTVDTLKLAFPEASIGTPSDEGTGPNGGTESR